MRALPVLRESDAPSRVAVREALEPMPESFGADGLPTLVDARGRAYRYLRLSVTDRCDLACVYCMPPGGEAEHAVRKELLSFEEAARLVRVFAAMGIRRVRFTGGEPLVRKDVVQLVELVRRTTEVERLALTTNATRLAELARPLRDAGLDAVNVSLDSLDADRFRRMTRGGDLRAVLAGIHAALDVGMSVKLNVVLVRGENEHEAPALVEWAWERGIVPRFIELMPLGEGAKLADRRVTADEVRALLGGLLEDTLERGGEDHGPAKYARAAEPLGRPGQRPTEPLGRPGQRPTEPLGRPGQGPTEPLGRPGQGRDARVGFITPLSDEFCGTCNRVRITAMGDVRACLASRRALSLRDVMREGGDDRALAWAIHLALAGKARGHFFTDADVVEHERVGMSLIGG